MWQYGHSNSSASPFKVGGRGRVTLLGLILVVAVPVLRTFPTALPSYVRSLGAVDAADAGFEEGTSATVLVANIVGV